MILHIGENISLLKKDIIFILNKESLEKSKENNDFLNLLISEGCLYNKIDKKTKTYIIVSKEDNKNRKNLNLKDKYIVYVSNIASKTLAQRNVFNF